MSKAKGDEDSPDLELIKRHEAWRLGPMPQGPFIGIAGMIASEKEDKSVDEAVTVPGEIERVLGRAEIVIRNLLNERDSSGSPRPMEVLSEISEIIHPAKRPSPRDEALEVCRWLIDHESAEHDKGYYTLITSSVWLKARSVVKAADRKELRDEHADMG